MDENQVTNRLIEAAIEVHRVIGPGLLESAYQQCLAEELRIRRVPFEREAAVGLKYKGLAVGCVYRADFLVADKVIVELKAVESLTALHRAQLLTYLKWSGKQLGLLINFNVPLLKSGVCRVINSH